MICKQPWAIYIECSDCKQQVNCYKSTAEYDSQPYCKECWTKHIVEREIEEALAALRVS